MFELEIFDLLATLCMGTFCLLSILYLVYLGYRFFEIRKNLTDKFLRYLSDQLHKEIGQQTVYTILAVILVFTLGVLTQDFTDHLSDTEESKNPIVSTVKDFYVIENEGELRMATLIKDDARLTGLGVQVFKNSYRIDSMLASFPVTLISDNPSKFWREHGKDISENDSVRTEFAQHVNQMYYTAKNWCYLNPDEIRIELMQIQSRIDLSRSLAIISFFTIVGVVSMYIAYLAIEFSRGRHRFKVFVTDSSKPYQKTVIKRVRIFPFKALAVLTLIFFVSRLCYSVAEHNFNERAFGYYISHFAFKSSLNSSTETE